MAKVFGFALAVIGLGMIAMSLKSVKESLDASLPFIAEVPSIVLIIGGIICIILAVFLARGNQIQKQLAEVPIYHGEQVVGFRRMGKK